MGLITLLGLLSFALDTYAGTFYRTHDSFKQIKDLPFYVAVHYNETYSIQLD